MKFTERTISSETIFTGKVFEILKQKVLLDDDSEASRELVIHHGGAGILAIDNDNNVYLVRQYRKGAESEMLEIPAGKLEKGEDAKECAIRELKEEVGAESKNITDLGSFFATPAYCSEKIAVFLATDLCFTGQKLDSGEFLEIIKMPFTEAYKMVMSNQINDAKTIIAILKAKELLNL